MEKELWFTLVSIAILWFGNFYYLRDILRWRSIPHPISYGIWFILISFNTYVLFLEREYYSFASWVFNSLTCLMFAGFGLYHYTKIERNWIDTICLILSICLIMYWLWSRNTTYSVMLTVIIDAIASLPTLKKSWLQPWTETLSLYFSSCIIASLTLLSLTMFTFETSIFWIYLILINLSIIIIGISRRYYLKGWKSLFE